MKLWIDVKEFEKMSQYWKRAIALFVVACICWYVDIVINPPNFEVILWITTVASSILCVCFVMIAIIRQIKPGVSSYMIFALTDGLLGAGVTAYAIYDLLTDTGWFAGLLGMMLLIFVVPVIILLLIIDFILYVIYRKKAGG